MFCIRSADWMSEPETYLGVHFLPVTMISLRHLITYYYLFCIRAADLMSKPETYLGDAPESIKIYYDLFKTFDYILLRLLY